MTKWLGRIGIALVVLGLIVFVGLATWEPFWAKRDDITLPERIYTAEIIRDDFGVPHIYGQPAAAVAYGVAVAHAEDDFFTLQDVIAMSRGRYGAIAGEEGAAFDYAYHLLDARGLAEREYPRLPEDTRALFDAYAAGLNEYAAAHPGRSTANTARRYPWPMAAAQSPRQTTARRLPSAPPTRPAHTRSPGARTAPGPVPTPSR